MLSAIERAEEFQKSRDLQIRFEEQEIAASRLQNERKDAARKLQNERKDAARVMKSKGYPVADIVEITGLSLEQIQAL